MLDNESIYELIRNLTRLFAALLQIKYTLFLITAPLHKVRESLRSLRIAKQHQNKPYRPLVSVLIPAWNEEIGIVSTIDSILRNDYQFIEVIVVNDGSTDRTESVIMDFALENKSKYSGTHKSLIYRCIPNGGKGKALNHALKNVRGDIVVTVDADSIADRQMIGKLVHYFADEKIDSVVGNVKVAGEIGFLNILQRLEYLFGFYHKRAHSFLGAEYIYGGACAAFRKSAIFDSIGNFDDSSITEDIEMSLRTKFHGLKATYADDAICYTEGANSIQGLIKQRLRWKKGRLEAFFKYKSMFLSTRSRHNKWLSWFILPFAVLGELQLLFEPIGLSLLVIYSMATGDYSSLILGALFIGIMYVVIGLFTEKGRNWWIIPLFPFTWMIFYTLVWVEYLALLKSISATVRAEGVVWQRWQRRGINIKKLTLTGDTAR